MGKEKAWDTPSTQVYGEPEAIVNNEVQMVARDGIEPPTPAFSGPRSTTELPGLSADFQLHFPARNPALPDKGGRLHGQCAATTWLVYQLIIRCAKTSKWPRKSLIENRLFAGDA